MKSKLEKMKMFGKFEDAVRFLYELCFRLVTAPYPRNDEFLTMVITDVRGVSPVKDDQKSWSSGISNGGLLHKTLLSKQSEFIAEMNYRRLNDSESRTPFIVNHLALALLNCETEFANYLMNQVNPSDLSKVNFNLLLDYPAKAPQMFSRVYEFANDESRALLRLGGTISTLMDQICSPLVRFNSSSDEKEENRKGAIPMVNLQDLEISDKVGKGCQGSVHLGKLDGETVAVKKFGGTKRKAFLRELDLLTKLKHRQIVSALAYYDNGEEFGIVFEFCETDLSQFMECMGVSELNTANKVGLLHQIAVGMAHIHYFSILHRDCKPDNILVQDWSVFKIADFGMAKEEIDDPRYSSSFGALVTRPPEYFSGFLGDGNVRGHKPGDVYAFAMIIYFVLHGKLAFEGAVSSTNISGLVLAGQRPEISREVEIEDPCLVSLMKRCWAQEPAARPTFSQIAHELYCQLFLESPTLCQV
eukprot:TRINITY_DN9537_c0_g1_i1.p1 TRINITY_DN9537_c0_g1~~TRINITY_DN9537_c0_g1_i1.p1  ORF type:complete len:508 (+),score=134.71 TRINITY_DN9537_c0_g1_i1:107-1525(+)